MGDFEDFKKVMLGYKAGGTLSGGGINIDKKAVNIAQGVDVESFMNTLAELNSDANTEDGWDEMMNDPQGAAYIKKCEDGNSLMRCTFKVDCTPEHALECFINTD